MYLLDFKLSGGLILWLRNGLDFHLLISLRLTSFLLVLFFLVLPRSLLLFWRWFDFRFRVALLLLRIRLLVILRLLHLVVWLLPVIVVFTPNLKVLLWLDQILVKHYVLILVVEVVVLVCLVHVSWRERVLPLEVALVVVVALIMELCLACKLWILGLVHKYLLLFLWGKFLRYLHHKLWLWLLGHHHLRHHRRLSSLEQRVLPLLVNHHIIHRSFYSLHRKKLINGINDTRFGRISNSISIYMFVWT